MRYTLGNPPALVRAYTPFGDGGCSTPGAAAMSGRTEAPTTPWTTHLYIRKMDKVM